MTDALIDRGAQILAEHFDMTEWRFLGPEEREEYRVRRS